MQWKKKKGEIARLESLDTGKPITLATNVDATRSITNFRFFAQYCQSLEEMNFTMEDATNFVVRKPVGVVGLIMLHGICRYTYSHGKSLQHWQWAIRLLPNLVNLHR